MAFEKGENPHHPVLGSSTKVEPIRTSFFRILWSGLKVTAYNHSFNLQSGDSVASCYGTETR